MWSSGCRRSLMAGQWLAGRVGAAAGEEFQGGVSPATARVVRCEVCVVGGVTLVVEDGRVRGPPRGRRDRRRHALPPGGRRHDARQANPVTAVSP